MSNISFRLSNYDPVQLKMDHEFAKRYTLETLLRTNTTKKIYFGKKQVRCVFCNRSKPETTFKMDAHAIPHFLGNKYVLFAQECDQCNAVFSKYENSFANFLGISRTLTGICGTGDKPAKFVDEKDGISIIAKGSEIYLSASNASRVTHDLTKNTLRVIAERKPYIPIHIPKLLLKIGLSMLPEEALNEYEELRLFVSGKENDYKFTNSALIQVIKTFIPGPPLNRTPVAFVFKKKPLVTMCFERILILRFSNYMFQICMPCSRNDVKLVGNVMDIPIMPFIVQTSYIDKYGKPFYEILDLSSDQKRKGELHELNMKYESRFTPLILPNNLT